MSLKSEINGPDRGAQPQKVGTSIKGGDVRFRYQKVGTSDLEKKVGTSPQVGTSKKVGTSVDVPTFSSADSRKSPHLQLHSCREGGREAGVALEVAEKKWPTSPPF